MHLSTVKIPINFELDWFSSSLIFSIMKHIFLPNLFALFLYYIKWDPLLVNISEIIVGDRSNQFGLLTEHKFGVNYRGAFRSIVAIAVNLLTSEDRYFLWITAVLLPRRCLQSRQNSGSRMRGVILALTGPPNLRLKSDHRYLILLLFNQLIASPKLYLPSVRSLELVQTHLQYIYSS